MIRSEGSPLFENWLPREWPRLEHTTIPEGFVHPECIGNQASMNHSQLGKECSKIQRYFIRKVKSILSLLVLSFKWPKFRL